MILNQITDNVLNIIPGVRATTISGLAQPEVRVAVDSGKLAQLGSRIIDGFAKKMADEFFQRFQQAVEGPVTVAEEEAAPEEPAPEGEPKKGWFKRLLG